jgi:RNA polymerase sigma-70 factor, ECF subfamily
MSAGWGRSKGGAVRDQESFDDFYASSMRRVVSHLYAITGSRAEAEDAVQEAYARAWARWGRISRYHDPEAWVRTVAYRIFVSAWRKAASRKAAHDRHGLPADESAVSPDYVAIIAALRQIPASQRQAIVLHHLVGRSVDEIAHEAHLPPGTVKARLSRGRRALAELLSDGGAVASLETQGGRP